MATTTRRYATQELCDQLNAEAVRIRDAEGLDDYPALERVIKTHGMTLVRKADDDQTRTYRLPTGELVNCWIEAPFAGIRDGGMGFDTQVED